VVQLEPGRKLLTDTMQPEVDGFDRLPPENRAKENLMKSLSSISRTALFAGSVALASMFPTAVEAVPNGGKVVVANRASGTISVISAKTDTASTIALPAGDNTPEPMYVFYSPIQNRVFVGDRANDRVVAFDAGSFEVDGTASVGAGVFHMWGSRATGELWVNNDIDNTTSVIDMRTLETVAVVSTPADLVAMGGKPHDVIVDPQGFYAYITVINVAGPGDYVVQVDARSYEIVSRAMVGDDPHVSLSTGKPNLYVAAQGSDVVNVLDRDSLAMVADIALPGAHGVGMRTNGRFLYTTNLPNGGTDALWVIDTKTNTVIPGPVDSPYTVPHNIALTPNGRKIYVTHSGAANDKVSVYQTRGSSPVPSYAGDVTVGSNPFGLAYVP
jgi:DNA-binding beta-propeller fold protein YncE